MADDGSKDMQVLAKKLEELTPDEVRAIMAESARRREEARNKLPEPKTAPCICGGTVSEHWRLESARPDLIGNSDPPLKRMYSIHCDNCGLVYHHLPNPQGSSK